MSPEEWQIFETARNAVLYRDAETASQTFNLFEIASTVVDAIENGTELDRERLERLWQAASPYERGYEPWLRTETDENGFTTVYDEDEMTVLRVEPPSPEIAEYYQQRKIHKQAVEDFISAKAPKYLAAAHDQLVQMGDDPAVVSALVPKGVNHLESGINLNQLEQAALNHVRNTLRGEGLIVREDHWRVGSDGSQEHPKSHLDHTLHRLTITRSEDTQRID